MNPKISLGIAIGLLLIAILYKTFSVVSTKTLHEHINGKWANTFSSFIINSKKQTLSILDLEDNTVIRYYDLKKEGEFTIVLNVEGDIYKMVFIKDDLDKKEMSLYINDETPITYYLVREGDVDPSKAPPLVDDPDEKLREINRKRRKGITE